MRRMRCVRAGLVALGVLLPMRAICASPEAPGMRIEGIEIKLGGMPDSADAVRWKILAARKGITSNTELENAARIRLAAGKKFPYDYHRVEVAGVNSTDDTNETMPDMFDRQFKMSFNSDEMREPGLSGRSYNFIRDLLGAGNAIRGELTPRAKEVLAPLNKKNIEELVAHSLGAEAVYVGILSGEITPPKRLLIVGVPEAHREKWRALARYTGVEVHVLGFKGDKAKITGDLADRMSRLVHGGLPSDSRELEALWASRCAGRNQSGCIDPATSDRRKFDYNVEIDISNTSKHETLPRLGLNHDRFVYYRHLKDRKILTSTLSDLQAPDRKLISEEGDRILADAFKEAEALIAKARKAARDADRVRDQALRLSLAEIAIRGCRDPGSVTQAELDALPRPSTPRFFEGSFPAGLDVHCSQSLYLSLATAIGRGGRLGASQAVPFVPVTPTAATPVFTPRGKAPPESVLVRSEAKAPFTAFFPELKILAQRACDAPASLSDSLLARLPFDRMAYAAADEQVAGAMTQDLDVCARGVFLALVRAIGEGKSGEIDRAWALAQAAAARPAPPVSRSSSSDSPSGSDAPPDYKGGPQTLPGWAPNVPKSW